MRPILPERPLPIRAGYYARYGLGSLACAAGALAIAYFGGSEMVSDAEAIQEDNRIWAAGVPADDGVVEGEERSDHFIFHSYDLNVEYHDAKGEIHRSKAKFSSVGATVDQKKEPIIHYMPDAPDQYALSWAIDLGGSRWGSFGVACFGLFMLSGTFGFLAWALSRGIVHTRAIAERSDEVLLKVTSVSDQIVNGSKTGSKIYRYSVSHNGEPEVTGETILAASAGPPLFGDAEGKTIVGLISPAIPRRPLMLRRDLYPFDYTPEQAVEIRERMETQWR